jgi:Flp pilus assembly protein TadG
MIQERVAPIMTSATKSSVLVLRLRDLARGEGGMAAVEFAVILPFMLVAYLGGVEVGDGVAINRKVAITTHAVADLASRYTTIHNSDSATILGASSTIISPYPSGPLAVTVSEVCIDSKGNATVVWSDPLNSTAHSIGSAVTLPGALASSLATQTGTCPLSGSAYLIWGEVTYTYTPTLGYVMTGNYPLSNQIFMSPRESASVTRIP